MPTKWEMVKEAALSIGREAAYSEIRQHVRTAYGDVNESSLTCAIIASSVNHPSRIHYQENKKPRVSLGEHDFLFYTGRGRVTPYLPSTHGVWEIYKTGDGQLGVRRAESGEDVEGPQANDTVAENSLFALESHLRDYLAKNISKIDGFGSRLSIYVSDDGRDGIEFQTDIGQIDILAVEDSGQLVVLELKLGRGPDATLGQILRYMGWVQKHLSNGKPVKGVIVASQIPTKLRYAVSQVPSVSMIEYDLSFSVRSVKL